MPRRILLLITDLEIGGTPTVVRELATRLNDPPDIEIEVACLSKWGPVADQLAAAGIRVTAINARGGRDVFRARRQLIGVITTREIDTVVSFLLHANFVAALSAGGLPSVRFIQSIQTIQPKPRWHWWLQSIIWRGADRIIVPSTAVAETARDRCGIPAERIEVIHNAIDPAEFPRASIFQPPGIRIGFLGRLDPVKRGDEFVQIIARMPPEFSGHIFGDGPDRDRIVAAINRHGVGNRVMLHGSVRKPQEALAQMDVLLSLSRGEGFGLVLIEAMASGVLVAAVSAGGVKDVINQSNAIVLAPTSIDLLSKQIVGSLQNISALPGAWQPMVDRGLATVREQFSWDVILPRYRALLGVR